ncbi:MAG: hypothetical protein SGPRY_013692, partial [Prymnesium sp.]
MEERRAELTRTAGGHGAPAQGMKEKPSRRSCGRGSTESVGGGDTSDESQAPGAAQQSSPAPPLEKEQGGGGGEGKGERRCQKEPGGASSAAGWEEGKVVANQGNSMLNNPKKSARKHAAARTARKTIVPTRKQGGVADNSSSAQKRSSLPKVPNDMPKPLESPGFAEGKAALERYFDGVGVVGGGQGTFLGFRVEHALHAVASGLTRSSLQQPLIVLMEVL